MPETPTERSLRARLAAHESWARTSDRTGRTESARRAFDDRFEKQVDPDSVLDPVLRAQMAESARRAYYSRMAYSAIIGECQAWESTAANVAGLLHGRVVSGYIQAGEAAALRVGVPLACPQYAHAALG